MNIQILLAELDRRIKFHNENQNDPHNIGNCCGIVLHEMRDAIAAAADLNKPLPCSSLVESYAKIITDGLLTTDDGTRATSLEFRRNGSSLEHAWIADVLNYRLKQWLTEFERRLEEKARDLKGK